MSRKNPSADSRWPVCRTADSNQPKPDHAGATAPDLTNRPAPAARRTETTTTTRLGRRDDRLHATADVQTRTSCSLDEPHTARSEPLDQQQDVPISGSSPDPGRRRRRRSKQTRERSTKVDDSTRVHGNIASPTLPDQASGDTCRTDENSPVVSTAIQSGDIAGTNVDTSKTDISNSACNVQVADQPKVTTLTSEEQSLSTVWIADIFDKLNDWTKDGNITDCKVLVVTTRQGRLRQQQNDNVPPPVLRPVVDSSFQWTEDNIKNAQ